MAASRVVITRFYEGVLEEQIQPKMQNLGENVARRMQRLVPKRTWALHDTIDEKTEKRGDKIVTTVSFGGGDVSYGLLVEKGTSRMKAQPFAEPAMLQSTGSNFNSSPGRPDRHGVIQVIERRGAAARGARGRG